MPLLMPPINIPRKCFGTAATSFFVFLDGDRPFPGVRNFIENALLVYIKEHKGVDWKKDRK
jgi:hypothetical protein